MSNRRELLSPIGEVVTKDVGLAPRLSDLNGKVIGFLDNEMLGSGVLLNRIKRRLAERFEFAKVETEKRFGNPARQAGEKLSQRCDFAIAALGC